MNKSLLIKVCGCGNLLENEALFQSREIDYVGFIFYKGSPRYVDHTSDISVQKVGVFVNESPELINRIIRNEKLDVVQFHGDETSEMIAQVNPRVKKWKALGISNPEDLLQIRELEKVTDTWVFDTKTPGYGGSGRSFPWEILKNYTGKTPFILSGGIGPEMLDLLRSFSHPALIGVDLNSRFESAPGKKNYAQILTFKQQLTK